MTSSLNNRPESREFSEDRSGANRVLVIVALVALALTIGAAIISTVRDTRNFSPDRPEGVVQAYLKAVIDGKNQVAVSYFATGSQCTASDLDRVYFSNSLRIALLSTEIVGRDAYVKIDTQYADNGPFGDGFTEEHTYRLTREGSQWKLLGIPWPLYDCGVVKK